MYHEFYHLRTLPFENTPDPRFFYASEQHREALAAIEYTIRMRKGFVLITGEIGSGKTTVGRTMCQRAADQATIVQVLHGHGDGFEMLRQIMRALKVPSRKGDDHGRALERLQAYLLQQASSRRPIVLFVDEAQTLSDAALEELRLLSNFDTATQKLIQVVLVGQPELRRRISSRRLDALRQRIAMSKQLTPMAEQETAAYIEHRLRAASVDPRQLRVQFTDDAVREIYQFTGGTPRLINFASDNCLLLGFVREVREITPAMVRRVIDDMLPSFEQTTEPAFYEKPQVSLAGNL